ncbi:uncharacterized protein LOC106639606 [Copidosoma floridanum]|uniref:uncharacterized protein LOC106639606 n=1 Tax=Copidosoma floridanum TaxID=29053 RepID=UPI0006C952B9|nr:uncharacterized protein LOC106639606 [Copidosoma floridanum]
MGDKNCSPPQQGFNAKLIPRSVMIEKMRQANEKKKLVKEKEVIEKARNEAAVDTHNRLDCLSSSSDSKKIFSRSVLQEQLFALSMSQMKVHHRNHQHASDLKNRQHMQEKQNSAHHQNKNTRNNKEYSRKQSSKNLEDRQSKSSSESPQTYCSKESHQQDVPRSNSYQSSSRPSYRDNHMSSRFSQNNCRPTPRPTPYSFSLPSGMSTTTKLESKPVDTEISFSLLRDRPLPDPKELSPQRPTEINSSSDSTPDSFKSAVGEQQDPKISSNFKSSMHSQSIRSCRKALSASSEKYDSRTYGLKSASSLKNKLFQDTIEKKSDRSATDFSEDTKQDKPYYRKLFRSPVRREKPRLRLSIGVFPGSPDSEPNQSSSENSSPLQGCKLNQEILKNISPSSDSSNLSQPASKKLSFTDKLKLNYTANSFLQKYKSMQLDVTNSSSVSDESDFTQSFQANTPDSSYLKTNEKISAKPCNEMSSDSESSVHSTNLSDVEEELLAKKTSTREGLLHLKAPVGSTKNPDDFYHSHGAMEPINWNEIRSNFKPSPENHERVIPSRITKPNELLEKYSTGKPDANVESKEFINFVDNTTTYKTIFETKGNIEVEPRAIDDPIAKIQRLINYGSIWNVSYLPKELQEVFKNNSQQSSSNVTEIIDYTQSRKSSKSLPTKTVESVPTMKAKYSAKKNVCSETARATYETIETKRESDEITESGPIDQNNTTHYTEYTDDMFDFEIPNSNHDVYRVKPNQPIDSPDVMMKKPIQSPPFNSNVDSDDTFLLKISELDSSLTAKDPQSPVKLKNVENEVLQNKLEVRKNSVPNSINDSLIDIKKQPYEVPSTRYCNKYDNEYFTDKESNSVNGEIIDIVKKQPVEKRNTKFYNKFDDEYLADEEPIQIQEIIIRKKETEEFLKPVSTRYFKKTVSDKQDNYPKISQVFEKTDSNQSISSIKEKDEFNEIVHGIVEEIYESDVVHEVIKEKNESEEIVYGVVEKKDESEEIVHEVVKEIHESEEIVHGIVEEKDESKEIVQGVVEEKKDLEEINCGVENVNLYESTLLTEQKLNNLDAPKSTIEIKCDEEDDYSIKKRNPKQEFFNYLDSNPKSSSDSDVDSTDFSESKSSSAIIKEIEFDSEMDKIDKAINLASEQKSKNVASLNDSLNTWEEKYATEIESVDSDEEFDFVNFENFPVLQQLMGSVKNVQNSFINQMTNHQENENFANVKAIADKRSVPSLSTLFAKNKNIFENVNLNINDVQKSFSEYNKLSVINEDKNILEAETKSDLEHQQINEAPARESKKQKNKMELLKKISAVKAAQKQNESSELNSTFLGKIKKLNLPFF